MMSVPHTFEILPENGPENLDFLRIFLMLHALFLLSISTIDTRDATTEPTNVLATAAIFSA